MGFIIAISDFIESLNAFFSPRMTQISTDSFLILNNFVSFSKIHIIPLKAQGFANFYVFCGLK
ncbi:hypothetical protein KCF3NO3_02200 [Chryseobacterium sp. KCF3-3]